MAGSVPGPIHEPISNGSAAILRHDLVTPINLIVGYCDLMIGESADLGQITWLAPLRSIRSLGFVLLKQIDQTLLSDEPDRSLASLQTMAQGLISPSTLLLHECDLLTSAILNHEATGDFSDDLLKIRAAGSQMISMAEELISGHFPSTTNAESLTADLRLPE